MDPHGPTVAWPHVIRTAPDQGDFPHSLREPRVMAHQKNDITPSLPSKKCCALLLFLIRSPGRPPQDPAGIPQGIPLTSTRETPE